MINLNDYINPISIERPDFEILTGNAGLPHNISIHTENNPIGEIKEYKLAIIGVPDGRNAPSSDSARAPDLVRRQLYSLAKIPGKSRIIDLGNMKQGAAFSDTIAGLTDVLTELLRQKVFPVVIGGSSALVPALDNSVSAFKTRYTMIAVDPRIDYSYSNETPDSLNYLKQIISNQKSKLDHYINIGFQTYLNDQQVLNLFIKRHAELIRIGDVRQAIHLTEPLFRDADGAILDISAVRQSDAPGTSLPSPNGFYGEEICLLARYAGISDNLKIFCLFDINPALDTRSQTTGLAAQIIWFFLEGFSQKQYENPALNQSNSGRFIKYHVHVNDLEEDLIFVKSNLTERWWLVIQNENHEDFYVACSYEDYLKANRNEIPDRWVKASNRLKA